MDDDDDLDELASVWRVDDAADQRRRRRRLGDADAQSATFAGLAADLAEQAAEVAVESTGGRRRHGRLVQVGCDFVAIDDGSGPAYLALGALTSVVVTRAVDRRPSGRRPDAGVDLRGTLADLALGHPRITVWDRGGGVRSGALIDVGEDVVRLRLDGDAGTAYVGLWSLAEASVTGSG